MIENEIDVVEDETTEDCADCGDTVTGDDVDDMTELGHGMVCQSCRDANYSVCDDCSETVADDKIQPVNGGDNHACDDCRDNNYFWCADCEEYSSNDWQTWIESTGTSVCESCCESSYGYCDHCENYYHYDNGPCCADDNCDCESPAQKFSIKNDGALLDNDDRVTINLPGGFVSDEGMGAISRLIRDSAPAVLHDRYNDGTSAYNDSHAEASKWRDLAYTLADNVGTEWQRKDGNFTKRLSRYAHKNYAIKVTPAILTAVGNIGSQHSQGANLDVEVTRDLNQSAAEFGHEDSCWWQSYYEGRCGLKSNGGFGLRSFATVQHDRMDYQIGPWSHTMGSAYTAVGTYDSVEVTGRAWVIPLKMVDGSLVETFDAEGADAFVAFNGYGVMGGYTSARVLGHLTGMTYRKVEFNLSLSDYEQNDIYVNSDAGYLIGAESVIANYTDGSLSITLDVHSSLYRNESRVTANV